uniref:Uncharacterized protein n=1 Tax=Arundo donax TaxID=35708 RepID=A0A0A9F051_ARUDO
MRGPRQTDKLGFLALNSLQGAVANNLMHIGKLLLAEDHGGVVGVVRPREVGSSLLESRDNFVHGHAEFFV